MTTATTSTARRNNKPPATALAEEDAHAAAEEVADRFIAAVRTAIERLPATPRLDDAAGELTAALHRIGADAQPAIMAASRAVGVFWSRPKGLTEEVRRTDAQAYPPAVLAAVDAALAGAAFTRRDELARAQAEVAALVAEERRLLTALEEAVSTGDVDRVMHLRPEVEVRLPAQRDAARLAVTELKLERAEAQRDRPRRRAEAAAQAEKTTRAGLEEAQAALEEATAAAQAAVQQRFLAEQVADQTAQRAGELEAEVVQLRAANSRSLTERLRRLAGLPAETPTTEPVKGTTR